MGTSRKIIPNRLRRYRRIAGYEQKEVAKMLGLRCTNRLSRWEQGLSMPSLVNVLKLRTIYNTLVEELYPEIIKQYRSELSKFKNKQP